MKTLTECIKSETASRVFREEEGKKILFEHTEYDMVCGVICMDGCVFNKVKGERSCDFLFLFDKSNQQYKFLKASIAWYVELKGTQLIDACEQLLNSIDKTMNEINYFDLNAIVVSTRKFTPQYDNNEYYRAVKRLIKKDIIFELTPHTIKL